MIRFATLVILLATSFLSHAADLQKGKAIAETICVACHAADGNSAPPADAATPANPKLAGQHPEYLLKQLKNFLAEGEKPALRSNATMAGMVMAITPDDMPNLAAWFASQKLNPAVPTVTDPVLIERGKKLWRAGNAKKGIPACAGCHGPAGKGMPAQYPALAGQFPEYTEAQLRAFRAGERANDAEKMMQTITDKMSDMDIKAVSQYTAGLR